LPVFLFRWVPFGHLGCGVYGSQLPVFLLRRVPLGHLGFFLEDLDEEDLDEEDFDEDLVDEDLDDKDLVKDFDLGGGKSGE
jgi:hypothetical protein